MASNLAFIHKIITDPAQAVNILKKSAVIFIIAGILEILLGLSFMHHVLFTGVLNLILGILLYFTQIYSLGWIMFLWSLVPPMGAFSNGWGINFQESCYAVLTLILAVVGAIICFAMIRLNQLRHPPVDDEDGAETKLSD